MKHMFSFILLSTIILTVFGGTHDRVKAEARSFPDQLVRHEVSHGSGLDVLSRKSTQIDSRWEDGIIPFQFDPAVSQALQNLVRQGYAVWNTATRIIFVERTAANASHHPHYLNIRETVGAGSATIGAGLPAPEISLNGLASLAEVVQTLGHAIGLTNEHQRLDRDAFVSVQWDSIEAGMTDNFQIRSRSRKQYTAYDFHSVMHFGSHDFSADGGATLAPAPGASPPSGFGTFAYPSIGDRHTVHAMYGWEEGSRVFLNPGVFNWRYYITYNTDLCAAGLTTIEAAMDHWINNGIAEGRRAHPGFWSLQYLQLNPDLTQAYGANGFGSAIRHYLAFGINENRQTVQTYAPVNLDQCPGPALLTDPLVFDWRYYISESADLCAAGITTETLAISHWSSFGVFEGRRAHREFAVSDYLQANPDLAQAFGSDRHALIRHWLEFGRNEGRTGVSSHREPLNNCLLLAE